MTVAERRWQILVVDDDEAELRQVEEFLQGARYLDTGCTCIPCREFKEAIRHLQDTSIDLVVLDIRSGPSEGDIRPEEEEGLRVCELVRDHQFVPVVFWSKVSYQARAEAEQMGGEPFVSVVDKTEGIARLDECIRTVMDSGLPVLQRRVKDHVRAIVRDTLWGWARDPAAPDPRGNIVDVAYYLMRRLARHLERDMLGEFLGAFGGQWNDGNAHPIQYYLKPPVGTYPMAGDIFALCLEDGTPLRYFVLLTPTCEIHQKKEGEEHLLYVFARALPAYEHPAAVEIGRQGQVGEKQKDKLNNKLKSAVEGKRERYFPLPAALGIPALFVDFQQVFAMPKLCADRHGQKLRRLASLDSPFAEALTSKFARFYSRIGTPDLAPDHVDLVIQDVIHQVLETGREAAPTR